MPTFSIAIPAYKTAFLRQCLDSIFKQTYANFEVVVLNDASPEPVREIVSLFSDSRLKYHENEKNVGGVDVVDNWNKCLSLAQGDYIICMGDDDMLPCNSLQCYAEAIEKYPGADVFHARTVIIDENGNPLSIVSDRAEWESVCSFVRHRIEGGMQFIGDFCMRRNKLLEIGGYVKFPMAWGSDDITVFEVAKQQGVVNLRNPSFFYRSNSSTISRSGNTIYKLKAISQEEGWYRTFLTNNNSINDEIDILDYKYIANHYQNKIEMKRGKCIAEDMRGNIFRWIMWWWKRNKFHLSNVVLLLAIYEYAKGEYLRKRNKNIAYS